MSVYKHLSILYANILQVLIWKKSTNIL